MLSKQGLEVSNLSIPLLLPCGRDHIDQPGNEPGLGLKRAPSSSHPNSSRPLNPHPSLLTRPEPDQNPAHDHFPPARRTQGSEGTRPGSGPAAHTHRPGPGTERGGRSGGREGEREAERVGLSGR